jgi:outer membrane receptor protein involved in Fe transport
VEVGAKGTQSNLNNDVLVRSQMEKIWRTLPEFSMEVHMTEDIGAGYVNMQHQFNSKTKLQAGLRYEYTHTHLTTPGESTLLQRRYGNWFPSAFLARDLRESSSIQVSYGRRITRPTFDVLAPFVYFFDPSTFFSGNLTLRPAISDALQATYRFHHRYLLSLGYTSEKDPIIPWQVHVDPATNQQNARAENLKSSDTYSLTFTFPVRVAAWWQMQTNLIGSWKNNRALYEGKVVQIEAGFGQVTHTQTFTLPHNFTAEVSAFYRTRSPFGLAYWRAFGAVNLGAKKKLKNDKGTISLTVNDLFWTSRFALLSYQPALNLNSSFIGYFSDPRIIRLTYSRTFGRSTGNALNKRSTGSEEERKRLNLN